MDKSSAHQAWLGKRIRALELFRESHTITSSDVANTFGISQRAARNLLAVWVEADFVFIADPAKKSRKYGLVSRFNEIFK